MLKKRKKRKQSMFRRRPVKSVSREKETKKKVQKKPEAAVYRHRAFSLTPMFILWCVLWVAAFIFTQLLRSSASNLFFGFINGFPIAAVIYLLISRAALKIYMISDSAVTEKQKPFNYEFRIINESFVPYPFIDAYIMLPQSNSVRCAERCVKVSMSPSSDYTVSSKVQFRFRGTYEIGVSCFYVYDFFRMFRMRVDFDSYDTIYVLPRKLVINEDTEQSVSDSTAKTRKSVNTLDKLEVSDIREYRIGDPLKNIHWNLSSKTEDLIVRDFNTGTTDMTYIFCDMSARFPSEPPVKPFVNPFFEEDAAAEAALKGENAEKKPEDPEAAEEPATEEASPAASAPEAPAAEAGKKKSKKKKKTGGILDKAPDIDIAELRSDADYEDMNEYCADGVVELTVASVLREIRAGRTVTLMWFDNRSDIGAFAFELHAAADFDTIFKLFATAPLAPAGKTVAKLSAMVSDTDDAKYLFVLPTIDDETVATLCTMPCTTDSASFGESEVIVYAAEERFAHPKERSEYIDGCAAQLAGSGLKLTKGTLDDVIVLPSGSADKESGKADRNG